MFTGTAVGSRPLRSKSAHLDAVKRHSSVKGCRRDNPSQRKSNMSLSTASVAARSSGPGTHVGAFLVRIRKPATVAATLLLFWTLLFVASLPFDAARAQQELPDSPKPKSPKAETKAASESNWPRVFSSGTDTFTIYQPQVDKWNENLIHLYCAVELKGR